jgi:hypothetical protein
MKTQILKNKMKLIQKIKKEDKRKFILKNKKSLRIKNTKKFKKVKEKVLIIKT